MCVLEAVHGVRFERTEILIAVQNQLWTIHRNLVDLIVFVLFLYLMKWRIIVIRVILTVTLNCIH